jgi:hypothetical protein
MVHGLVQLFEPIRAIAAETNDLAGFRNAAKRLRYGPLACIASCAKKGTSEIVRQRREVDPDARRRLIGQVITPDTMGRSVMLSGLLTRSLAVAAHLEDVHRLAFLNHTRDVLLR